MSRVKKKLAALAFSFSLEFLPSGFFTSGTFSWTNQHIPAAEDTDAGGRKLDSPVKTDGGVIVESYGERTSRSAVFLIAIENSKIFIRSFVIGPLFFRITLPPKVSRYISNSVLNL
jgi:hypothetical protein